MFQNYFTVATRNLLRQKLISFINLSGLTAGHTARLLISAYARCGLSFDNYDIHADQVYRLTRDFNSETLTLVYFVRS
ncbi:MAG TPA: hypothetical protein VKR32_11455 [Puia sp.]|nr:hypothetical protein [Puia sp.]